MKKYIALLLCLLSFGFIQAKPFALVVDSDIEKNMYNQLHLGELGMKYEILQKAIHGWSKLNASNRLANPTIISIIDFSQSSKNKRLYIIDLQHIKLLFNTYVAHGKNTGSEFATSFSNAANSLKTSLGFYITASPIMSSKHGEALQINGIEKGFNDNALSREIIIHAADYACESFIQRYGMLGRSFGCPAIPPAQTASIIATIKSGTCLFLYYPDNDYICHSTLLN